MSAPLKPSRDLVPAAGRTGRHGRAGHVRIYATVTPAVRDRLVEVCEIDAVPMRVLVSEAIDFYLDAVGNPAVRTPRSATGS